MTWPFENDTGAIVKKLAKRSLASEKRRNRMVVIAVALAAFLVCLSAVISVSIAQIQRNQVADTYEAVFTGVEASDVAALKGMPEFARVGEYYLLGQEHSGQGYNASYVYCDSDMMYIARSQMELVKGELPAQANEVAVSEYFLSAYGLGAKIGETVRLDTESFHGDYTVTGILFNVGEKEANICAIVVSKAALTQWAGFDSDGYRAYVHFKNDRQFGQETMAAHCREIAAQFGSAHVGMNSNYFASNSRTIDFLTIFGIAALVLAGGYVVIQSIFRISVNDKIQSYGQLRTIGATPKQIRRIVKKESRRLGGIGILLGILLGVGVGLLLFPKGFHGGYYGVAVLLTMVVCWVMVASSVHRPVKIAAGISPLEAMRFTTGQEKVHNRKKHRKLSPISMGFANFGRDRKKSVSIAVSLSLGGILLLVVSSMVLTRSVESSLHELVSGRSNLGMDTIATHIEYEKMQSSIIFGSLQALSWLIFLFGVVNLINTTLSNQMSRKRENSILRSVGLTGKQLCRMSVTEGMCHALFAALTVLILGLPISMAVCAEVSKKSFAGAVVPYQFPFLQMGLFLLVLFGMEAVLSVWMVRRQKKQSLVEQMRAQG